MPNQPQSRIFPTVTDFYETSHIFSMSRLTESLFLGGQRGVGGVGGGGGGQTFIGGGGKEDEIAMKGAQSKSQMGGGGATWSE